MQETDVSIYLACCYKVLEGMDCQAKDVIIVAHVESLGILLPVVHNPNGSHVVDYLPGLSVEQVAPAIVASVAETKRHWFIARETVREKRIGKNRHYVFIVLSCCPTHE